jgi:hypothetical protein
MNSPPQLALEDLVLVAAAVSSFWETYGEENPEDTAHRCFHWHNVVVLHAKVRQQHYSRVDLSRVGRKMEELLYSCVVLDHFTPRPLAEPGQVISPPLYTAEQAGLRVFFERGAWWATWIKLEEPFFQPDSVRRQLFVIEQGEDGALRYRDLAAA